MSVLLAALLAAAGSAAEPAGRSVVVAEQVRVIVEKPGTRVRLWLPKPPTGPGQEVELLDVTAPWPHRLTQESEFGNETLFFEGSAAAAGEAVVSVRYRVTRWPQDAPLRGKALRRDRRPQGREVIDAEIRAIAANATKGLRDPLAKGRALYRVVLARMAYDKSGEGWGEGDSLYACRVGKGNCTDFHSLFMALAHAAGLPARFRMGYSLPLAAKGSLGGGYHCWAEFHAGGAGWVPVDISEAWKHPEKAEFYFGRLDADRVLVSTGREIELFPRQVGAPLNFLNRPYAELDGEPRKGLSFERDYDAG
ncbi:MAG: transglutaminase domain-containing protein [Elusimicrobia bacterium]|nr:transglutaminase domain-containing protein [Elusimicrobiota bacterium]